LEKDQQKQLEKLIKLARKIEKDFAEDITRVDINKFKDLLNIYF